jgi:NitT/TauT family transport system substrate-binding protein
MSSPDRRKFLIGAGAAAILGAGGFAAWRNFGNPDNITSGELQKLSLRLSWIPQGTFAGDYAAQMQGFWKSEGLDVTINPGGFQYDSIKLVAAKTDMVGIASGAELMEARANGVPIVAIGVVIPDSPIAWVSKADSGIKRVEDFVGKKVGDQTGSLTEITLDAVLAKLGMNDKQFQRVPMQFDYQPFLSGAIDVAPVYVIDQVVTFKRNGLKINIIDPRTYDINLGPANLYFVHEDTLKSSKPVLARFLKGAAKGWMFAESNREQVAKYLTRFIEGGNVEDTTAQMDAVFEFVNTAQDYPGVFDINSKQWNDTANVLGSFGRLNERFDPNLAYKSMAL